MERQELSERSLYKLKYDKYKAKVKLWECEFKEKNGRLPNKNDINEAEVNVKEAYKLYYKLKMKLTNNSATDKKVDTCTDLCSENPNYKSQEPDDKTNQENITNFSDGSSKCWGNVQFDCKDQQDSNTSCKLSNKKIKLSKPASKFSLSKSRFSFNNSKNLNSSFNSTFNSSDNDLDLFDPFFVSNDLKIKNLENKPATQPVNVINNVKTKSSVEKFDRNLDMSWVDRCSEKLVEKKEEAALSNSFIVKFEENASLKNDDNSKNEASKIPAIISFGGNKVMETCDDKMVVDNNDEDEVPNSDTEDSNEKKHSRIFTTLNLAKSTFVPLPLKKSSSGSDFESESSKPIKKSKIKTGSLSDNFVKINLKKKTYVRGKKHFNFSKYKKTQWKQRKKATETDSNSTVGFDGDYKCFQCGESGHFADKCPQMKEDGLLPMVESKLQDEILDEFFEEEFVLEPRTTEISSVYKSIEDTPLEVLQALAKFGHSEFRPGQEEAIMRILGGLSTLVTLSTGSGKSLCYQLPAYLYATRSQCITLVISPLVSLMEDQITGVPDFLKAACLHTNLTKDIKEKVIARIRGGELHVLLISPEAVVAGEKSADFGKILRSLPPIAFACIDEAHCISQWSHNFRPSYLTVCKILKEKMGVKTILALSATATRQTALDLVDVIEIPDGLGGIISNSPLPNNLVLTVSKDEDKDRALIDLLNSEKMSTYESIIVYCTRRDTCSHLAKVLDSTFGGKNKFKTKTQGRGRTYFAEAYHAGLSASSRKAVQKRFMTGKTRVVVATVAFGMGINKADIRAVIHYNMPATFEGYTQEVGRAGRDGEVAHCHLFINPEDDVDKLELQRHIFTHSIDKFMVRKLLKKVFTKCECKEQCRGHEIAICKEEIVQDLDLSEEAIETLLRYLELHPKKFLKKVTSGYMKAKVYSPLGVDHLKTVAQNSKPLQIGLELATNTTKNCIEFPVIRVAAALGWESGSTKRHLKNLEWIAMNDKESRRSKITVTFDTLGFVIQSPGDLTPEELDEALDHLAERNKMQEKISITKLNLMYDTARKFCFDSIQNCLEFDERVIDRSNGLKESIRSYFNTESQLDLTSNLMVGLKNEAQVASDIRGLICSYTDTYFNGRVIARIFHGIQSPNYSALAWSRCRFWRAHIDEDFNEICSLASKELLKIR